MSGKILCGDSLSVLRTLPSDSIDCCVTSPPYWSLRNYNTSPQIWDGRPDCVHEWGNTIISKANMQNDFSESGLKNDGRPEESRLKTNANSKYNGQDTLQESSFCTKCGAWRGELGLEPDFKLYIKHLCDIFDEVKRVLKPSGTCFVNLGDTYISKGETRHIGYSDPKNTKVGVKDYAEPSALPQEIPEKCLAQIPYRFSIEMCDRGWWLRNVLIWHKPNAMPQSVKDRFSVDFEPVFFFTKSKRYYFEQQFEPIKYCSIERMQRGNSEVNKYANGAAGQTANNLSKPRPNMAGESIQIPGGRNKRCVWEIPTQSNREHHFAMFPEKLVTPMIKSGCPKYICKKCGKAREPIFEPSPEYAKLLEENKANGINQIDFYPRIDNKNLPEGRKSGFEKRVTADYKKTGYTDCGCNEGFYSGTLLDPFGGAGTSGVAAKKQGRNYVLIDVNPKYCEIAKNRIAKIQERLDMLNLAKTI